MKQPRLRSQLLLSFCLLAALCLFCSTPAQAFHYIRFPGAHRAPAASPFGGRSWSPFAAGSHFGSASPFASSFFDSAWHDPFHMLHRPAPPQFHHHNALAQQLAQAEARLASQRAWLDGVLGLGRAQQARQAAVAQPEPKQQIEQPPVRPTVPAQPKQLHASEAPRTPCCNQQQRTAPQPPARPRWVVARNRDGSLSLQLANGAPSNSQQQQQQQLDTANEKPKQQPTRPVPTQQPTAPTQPTRPTPPRAGQTKPQQPPARAQPQQPKQVPEPVVPSTPSAAPQSDPSVSASPSFLPADDSEDSPQLLVSESGDWFDLSLHLPSIPAARVSAQLRGNHLLLTAERHYEDKLLLRPEEVGRAGRYATIRRRWRLPSSTGSGGVDVQNVWAQFDRSTSVLRVRLFKMTSAGESAAMRHLSPALLRDTRTAPGGGGLHIPLQLTGRAGPRPAQRVLAEEKSALELEEESVPLLDEREEQRVLQQLEHAINHPPAPPSSRPSSVLAAA